MDQSTERKIEIFAPCSAALDLTKLILFQPFDLTKWFVIGFAAFLSHLAGGGGGSFNYNPNLGKGNWNFRSTTHDVVPVRHRNAVLGSSIDRRWPCSWWSRSWSC